WKVHGRLSPLRLSNRPSLWLAPHKRRQCPDRLGPLSLRLTSAWSNPPRILPPPGGVRPGPVASTSTLRQTPLKGVRLREAPYGPFVEAPQHDRPQIGRQFWAKLARWHHGLGEMGVERLHRGLVDKRRQARQQEVGHCPQAVDVAASVQVRLARRLLRR